MSFADVKAAFEARSLRERILIALTLLALTWAVWILTVGGHVLDTKAEVITDIHQLEGALASQTAQRLRLQALDQAPARAELKAKRDALTAALELQQAELDDLLEAFIPPARVPALLKDVLKAHRGLRLKSLASLPAVPITAKRDETDAVTHEAAEPIASRLTIYRHPVTVEVEGAYGDVVAYLASLEATAWRFSWREIEYVVEDYPDARVRIEIETLSREQAWLGV